MTNKHLHVALASDTNYAEFVAVVLVSLFETNTWFDFATIHLLSNGIDVATLDKLKNHVPKERGEIKVYDISSLEGDLGISVPPTIAITSYARLFLPQLLERGIERVLYLDCDIVINGDISNFYLLPISNNDWVAGVYDTLPNNVAKTSIALKANDVYYNAGVLLFNLNAWRENNITKLCLDFLLDHGGNVFHHDQGIINAVCHEHKKTVPPKFNTSTSYFSHKYSLLKMQNNPFYSETEVEEAIKEPAIIHFTEGFYNRPWISNSKHPFRSIFLKYKNKTEWADTPFRSDKRSIAAKILAWSFLNLPYKGYIFIHSIISFLSKIKS